MAQVSIFGLKEGLRMSSLDGMFWSCPSPVKLAQVVSSGMPDPERKRTTRLSGVFSEPKSLANAATSSADIEVLGTMVRKGSRLL